jgi:hypothetical protein
MLAGMLPVENFRSLYFKIIFQIWDIENMVVLEFHGVLEVVEEVDMELMTQILLPIMVIM